RLPAGFLDRYSQLFGRNGLVSVGREVMVERRKEQLISEMLSQHMQNRPAARIRIVIEHRVLVRIIFCYDRSPIALPPGVEHLILIAANIGIEELLVSFKLLVPHRLHVSRETLVEPDLAPIAAGYVVAEPLVC